jgi:hypothetical protein
VSALKQFFPLTMTYDKHATDLTALTLLGIISIIAVFTLVVGLPPGEASSDIPLPAGQVTGAAFDYGATAVPVGTQFDISDVDMNQDGMLDFYDVLDIFTGKVNCNKLDCDFNDDGFLDAADAESLTGLIIRLYDYDQTGFLERNDPRFLLQVMQGTAACTADMICDLNGDGLVSSDDITLYTPLLYNYDLG